MQRRGCWWWRPGRAGLDREGRSGRRDRRRETGGVDGWGVAWGYWKRRRMETWRGAPVPAARFAAAEVATWSTDLNWVYFSRKCINLLQIIIYLIFTLILTIQNLNHS